VRRAHPAEAVELWAQDEARLGLKPVTRRVWAPRGERPTAHARPGYEWLWLYAAVHPASGRVFWLVLPYLNAGMMQRFLDAFAREHAPAGRRIVMVLDGASAHRARSLRVPERITLVSLPAYTPELNPTERLWPAVKEGVANRSFDTLAELEAVVCVRCQKISAAPEQVAALTNYHWLPTA
jgi:transposase